MDLVIDLWKRRVIESKTQNSEFKTVKCKRVVQIILWKYGVHVGIYIYGGCSHVLLASLFLFLFYLEPREILFLIILLSSPEKLDIYIARSLLISKPYKSQIWLVNGIGIKIFLQSGFISASSNVTAGAFWHISYFFNPFYLQNILELSLSQFKSHIFTTFVIFSAN